MPHFLAGQAWSVNGLCDSNGQSMALKNIKAIVKWPH